MIRINRGDEPNSLKEVRRIQLESLRKLGRAPIPKEIDGYRVVSKDLWRAQHYKCCYCERKIPEHFNDVEHYRPKGYADRRPGCVLTHGYWWLAFNWNNLMFACPACNRSAKNARFPTQVGSLTLQSEEAAPGFEVPLLLDPCADINPVAHIQFVQIIDPVGVVPAGWWATPREQSIFGEVTIEICDMNNVERRELRQDYYETILSKRVARLSAAIDNGSDQDIRREFEYALELLKPRLQYVAFAFDVLSSSISNETLNRSVRGLAWPEPAHVGRA